MTKTVTLSFEDYEMKALESEFVDVSEFFQNFVNHRYQLREKIILETLLAHCNANSIALATGASAQIDQAYDLGLIAKAVEEEYKDPAE